MHLLPMDVTKDTTTTLTILENPAAPISGGDQTECEEDPIQTFNGKLLLFQ